MMNYNFIVKDCVKCKKERKFMVGSERDKNNICGNCWDWLNDPTFMKLTSKEQDILKKFLQKFK